MDSGTVYQKTAKGRQEVESRSRALSMLERRVLILADGRRTAEQIQKLSHVDDFSGALEKLLAGGYVERPDARSGRGEASANARKSPRAQPAAARAAGTVNTQAREFMLNMLLTFTNRVRVARLLEAIAASQSDEELQRHLDDWYFAIAESPNGVGEADSLRSKLIEMLLLGE